MSDRRVVLPLELNMGHGQIFTMKTGLVNKEISTNAKFAEIEEIKVRKLENDVKNNQVVVNMSLPNEKRFNYNDTGISIEKGDAQRAAAIYNRDAREEVQKTIDQKYAEIQGLETLMEYYDVELPKVNLI
jgi:hypothetical protein